MAVHYKFDKGNVKVTKNQIKKHTSQFSDTERAILDILIKNLAKNKVYISDHALKRLKTVSKAQIYDCLATGQVIELNVTEGKCRALVRGDRSISAYVNGSKCMCNLCIVIDLKTSHVVTCYLNRTDDVHSGLDIRRYDGSINILELAKTLS